MQAKKCVIVILIITPLLKIGVKNSVKKIDFFATKDKIFPRVLRKLKNPILNNFSIAFFNMNSRLTKMPIHRQSGSSHHLRYNLV